MIIGRQSASLSYRTKLSKGCQVNGWSGWMGIACVTPPWHRQKPDLGVVNVGREARLINNTSRHPESANWLECVLWKRVEPAHRLRAEYFHGFTFSDRIANMMPGGFCACRK